MFICVCTPQGEGHWALPQGLTGALKPHSKHATVSSPLPPPFPPLPPVSHFLKPCKTRWTAIKYNRKRKINEIQRGEKDK